MPASWTQRTDPYASAILAAQSLLHAPVDANVFDPVTGFVRRNPPLADRTYDRFFANYLPEAIHTVASQQRYAMEARALKKLHLPPEAPAAQGLILDPKEVEEAIQSLGLITSMQDGRSNYYKTTEAIEEWARALYPNLRHLSEGDTSLDVRNALSTSGLMLELAEFMVGKEENRLTATIASDRTEWAKKLVLRGDLERTETLHQSIDAIQKVMAPVYRPLITERGIG